MDYSPVPSLLLFSWDYLSLYLTVAFPANFLFLARSLFFSPFQGWNRNFILPHSVAIPSPPKLISQSPVADSLFPFFLFFFLARQKRESLNKSRSSFFELGSFPFLILSQRLAPPHSSLRCVPPPWWHPQSKMYLFFPTTFFFWWSCAQPNPPLFPPLTSSVSIYPTLFFSFIFSNFFPRGRC